MLLNNVSWCDWLPTFSIRKAWSAFWKAISEPLPDGSSTCGLPASEWLPASESLRWGRCLVHLSAQVDCCGVQSCDLELCGLGGVAVPPWALAYSSINGNNGLHLFAGWWWGVNSIPGEGAGQAEGLQKCRHPLLVPALPENCWGECSWLAVSSCGCSICTSPPSPGSPVRTQHGGGAVAWAVSSPCGAPFMTAVALGLSFGLADTIPALPHSLRLFLLKPPSFSVSWHRCPSVSLLAPVLSPLYHLKTFTSHFSSLALLALSLVSSSFRPEQTQTSRKTPTNLLENIRGHLQQAGLRSPWFLLDRCYDVTVFIMAGLPAPCPH